MSGEASASSLPFGAEAAGYEAGRPDYPPALYEALFQELNLSPGLRGFEVGAGTGLATRALMRRGLQLLAIEPDPRMAARLRAAVPGAEVIPLRMEEADLPEAAADFGVSAMAMHWLEPATALPRARRWLKPGAGFAMWWTVFGDPAAPDDFQRASQPFFAGQGRGRGSSGAVPYALQREARLQNLTAAGFEGARAQRFDWKIRQSTAEVVNLCRSFSPVLQMAAPARAAFLSAIADLVDRDFGGQVERDFVTLLYTARRPL
ncbi:class I SAM-dependent methyltransferase [Falsigemmobacter faecalis]|uniref:Class I SAM-dependent methyltransferase n=1 Tax=Falsigemmobacter faecalis TaxID=2488730 RepID=A0A3P3E055_9RHOB|nr:class I SAM-dependent methyltransferase [Falsigemmobacter faecalis]RRH78448.1 class I SAM-dependent methyltransferase [Falsigemmobacter faecalis]